MAWSLLLWALRREGLETLPETGLDARGRPCFPGREDIRFSLSHTEGWALCALGRAPLGADVQLISPRDEAFAARLMSGASARISRCTSSGACARASTSSRGRGISAPCAFAGAAA